MERGLSRPVRQYSLNTTLNILYVIGVCIICWAVCFLDSYGIPIDKGENVTPIWRTVSNLLFNREIAYSAGILLLFGSAFLLQRANYALMLIRERTILPFLLYLLYVSTNPVFIPLKSSTICVFCLLLAIYLLFTSYHDEQAVGSTYKAALTLAIGSLFWIHILWFLPLFWRGMYNFKSWSPRILAASLFGIVTVYWFVFGWCIWQNDYTLFTEPFTLLVQVSPFRFTHFSLIDWLSIFLVGSITLAAAVNILANPFEENLRTRQFLSFLILFAVWSFVLFFLYAQSSDEFLQILCLPAAILTAHFFTVKRNGFMTGIFHLTVISCVSLLFIRIWSFL